MLITFEGIDGSGKSTQAVRLVERLRAAGRDVRAVREPGGTVLGERVRALLLDPASPILPTAELLLFSAARAQLVEEVVRPALAAGAVVVADRFYDSSTAYQGGGRGLASGEEMDRLHALATGGLAPALTFLIDVPVEVAVARRAARAAADRMEAGGTAFFERTRAAYLDLATRHPERVVVLDGTRTPDDLHAEVMRRVEGWEGGRTGVRGEERGRGGVGNAPAGAAARGRSSRGDPHLVPREARLAQTSDLLPQ